MDDYFSRGIIPASLIRWEMTGLDDEMTSVEIKAGQARGQGLGRKAKSSVSRNRDTVGDLTVIVSGPLCCYDNRMDIKEILAKVEATESPLAKQLPDDGIDHPDA